MKIAYLDDLEELMGLLAGKTRRIFFEKENGAATQSTDGLQSAADKKKLDGIENGANKTLLANHLLSNVEGTALDAVQGKLLKDEIDEMKASFEEAKSAIVGSALGKKLGLTAGSLWSVVTGAIAGVAVKSGRPNATATKLNGSYLALTVPKGYYDGTVPVECTVSTAQGLVGGGGYKTALLISTDSREARTVDVTGYPGYKNFTLDNFFIKDCSIMDFTAKYSEAKNPILSSYDAGSGILHLAQSTTWGYQKSSSSKYYGYYINYSVYVIVPN